MWVIELADGRVPLLVRDFGHAVGVCVDRTQAWLLAPGKLELQAVKRKPSAAAPTPTELRDAILMCASEWARTHAPTHASLFEVLVRLRSCISEALGEDWIASVSGTQIPNEGWLHADGEDRHMQAAVGVFGDAVVIEHHRIPIPARTELLEIVPEVLDRVRAQQAAYARNVALSNEIRTRAVDIARLLSARVAGPCRAQTWSSPTYWTPIDMQLFDANHKQLGQVRAVDGEIVIEIGLPDDDGWRGTEPDLDAMVAAIELEQRSLTIESLIIGARYRVITDIGELRKGMIVRFVDLNELDNHYGVCVFEDETGQTRVVPGDYSDKRRSPLGPAYRYLEPVVGG
jgi:hypothetical protein